jgi:LPXTG-motif cell wall-anchored protein
LDPNITEDEQLSMPVWAGVALAIVGGGLLVSRKK